MNNSMTNAIPNREIFRQIYTQELTKAVREFPAEYGWPVENVPVVVEKMLAAMDRGSYNKDSRAIKSTCKRLGIKFTYKGISEFWRAV